MPQKNPGCLIRTIAGFSAFWLGAIALLYGPAAVMSAVAQSDEIGLPITVLVIVVAVVAFVLFMWLTYKLGKFADFNRSL